MVPRRIEADHHPGSVNLGQTDRRTSERVFPSKRLGKGKAKERLHTIES